MASDLHKLRAEIRRREQELDEMKQRLIEMERQVAAGGDAGGISSHGSHKLTNQQIGRYSRQLILPELGVKGQLKLLSSQVLIVGAGGLGCPAAIYLAAAGVGTLGIVDYDEVEISNLHRQVLHTEHRVGQAKAESVAAACRNLNSSVKFRTHRVQLNSENALSIIRDYDVVLDATDNVATRYLLNDACVIAAKPLVSGSALRFEGQMTVYNHKGGPCYRCLYPKPPPPETVTNCSDGGVIGVVPGIIGCYQALEAIKIAADIGTSLSQRLMLFDGADCTTRTIKLRGRQGSCPVCSDQPSITQLIDYQQFCGASASDKDQEKKLLPISSRMTAKEYHALLASGERHVLLDVRLPVEMEICQLPHAAVNVPLSAVKRDPAALEERLRQLAAQPDSAPQPCSVVVVCRRGNDSQVAVQLLRELGSGLEVKDIRGGLHAWARDIDASFPVY